MLQPVQKDETCFKTCLQAGWCKLIQDFHQEHLVSLHKIYKETKPNPSDIITTKTKNTYGFNSYILYTLYKQECAKRSVDILVISDLELETYDVRRQNSNQWFKENERQRHEKEKQRRET